MRHHRGLVLFCVFALAIVGAAGGSQAGGSNVDQAAAAPDYDGDGYIANDCKPLDPAVHPGAADSPDLLFEDLNCDGIDGNEAGAYFVSGSGNDTNAGSRLAPFLTIQRAVDAARGSATKDVYVATGSYNRVSLPADADGVRIYGGYQAGTWARTSAAPTTVNGSPEAMFLDGAADVVVQLVTLNGASGLGLNAYGVRAVNGSEVALIGVNVAAGAGGAGTDGGAGSQPAQAADGAPGLTQSVPVGEVGSACDHPGAGGSGAQLGNGFDGGAGGTGGQETNDGENGQPGIQGSGGPPGGIPGPGGTDLAGDADNSAANENGKPGQTGASGASGTNGPVGGNDFGAAAATWIGRNGGSGGGGAVGRGGGGGGGGAGDGSLGAWSTGAGGGQGGDGGSGGGGGGLGGCGGGSFGVYLQNSQVVVDGSTVQTTGGGRGGHGGAGGPGGAGGDGGPGGVPFDCPGKEGGFGGEGGDGGQGGPGGTGGGGSGGPSAAVFRVGTSVVTNRSSTLTAGSGGAGGTGGSAATGQAGQILPAGTGGVTDFDGDGITDASDSCVETPRGGTDANGDGCPDRAAALPDGDSDGVPNAVDACPTTHAGTNDVDENGCPGDNTAPAAPTGIAQTAASQTTVSVSWNTSTDNVGVTGYDLFLNGAQVASTPGTAHTFSGLSCGQTYTVGVEAFDAGANRSARSAASASTSSCPVTPPPPPPPVVKCKVPKLAGKTLAQAKSALTRANCKLGRVTKAYSAKVKKNRVMKQSPAVGRMLAKGAKVNVTLSKGRRP